MLLVELNVIKLGIFGVISSYIPNICYVEGAYTCRIYETNKYNT